LPGPADRPNGSFHSGLASESAIPSGKCDLAHPAPPATTRHNPPQPGPIRPQMGHPMHSTDLPLPNQPMHSPLTSSLRSENDDTPTYTHLPAHFHPQAAWRTRCLSALS
jgi:hypothetical protein